MGRSWVIRTDEICRPYSLMITSQLTCLSPVSLSVPLLSPHTHRLAILGRHEVAKVYCNENDQNWPKIMMTFQVQQSPPTNQIGVCNL